jgi:hypothetical protein
MLGETFPPKIRNIENWVFARMSHFALKNPKKSNLTIFFDNKEIFN